MKFIRIEIIKISYKFAKESKRYFDFSDCVLYLVCVCACVRVHMCMCGHVGCVYSTKLRKHC